MMFSIIVPIYNIQEYISECIESILCQEYKNFELILVDDGSTDESKEIIKQYAIKDNRIVCIFQENQGPGAARNNGLKHAKGDYVIFVDGDDFFYDSKSLETIYRYLNNNIDIIIHPVKRVSNEDKIVHNSLVIYREDINQKDNFVDVLSQMIREGKILSAPYEMVFNKQFLLKNNLYFMEGIFSEDIEWIVRIMMNEPKTFFVNYQFYCYRFDRIGSTCNSEVNPDKLKKIISFVNDHYKNLVQSNKNKQLNKEILNYLAYHWCVCASNISMVKGRDLRNELYNYLMTTVDILKYNEMKKVKVFSICKKALGVRLTSNLGRIRYYLKRLTL